MITRALAVLLIALTFGGSAAGVAVAQTAPGQSPSTGGGFGPFGPLPQSAPEPAPVQVEEDDGLTGRETLYIVLGIVALGLIGLGVFITRDARNAAPALVGNRVPDRDRDLVPGAPGDRQAKQKSKKDRQKAKAARAARKRTTRQR